MMVDFLESIVSERCHGVGGVFVPHAYRMFECLQHAPEMVHVNLRRQRLLFTPGQGKGGG